MIHITEIKVPNDQVWCGKSFQAEVSLPSRVRHLRAILATAIPDKDSFLKLIKTQGGDYGLATAQVGTLFASIDNTQTFCDGVPLCATSRLSKNTFAVNKIDLPDGGFDVRSGASLRVCVEEVNECPFETRREALDEYKAHLIPVPDSPTMGYTVKFYIDYN